MRSLSAETCAAELAPVGESVTAANTATPSSCERIACSLACAPYWTVIDGSIRAVADARGLALELPVYQATVLAEPLTSEVAVLGEPETRSGGWTAVTVAPKPSAPSAAVFELVTFRLAALSVCSVITPPLMVDGVEVPVIESIFDSSVWTLSVTLSWLPVAPEATKVMGVPLTVMVSPAAKLVEIESEPARPDKAVAPVIGAASLVVDHASRGGSGRIEEVVPRFNRRGGHQRRIGERADRRIQRRVQIAGRRRRRRADGEASGGRRVRARRRQLNGSGGAVRQIEGEAHLIARAWDWWRRG